MEAGGSDPNCIEFPVPANEWQDYVDSISEKLKQKPDPKGPPTATFTLKDGKKLCVTEVNAATLLAAPTYSAVAKRGFVDIIYELLPDPGKKPYDVQVIDEKGQPYSIRLAGIKFRSKDELVDKSGGVIHNPPRSEQ